MQLSDLPKFDASLFSKSALKDLQTFTDQCEAADNPGTIEDAGAELDARRADQREAIRQAAARSRSLQAVFKYCVKQVPRPMWHPEPDGELVT